MSINADALYSSRFEEWETPQSFFDVLNEEFHFDIDVCATKENAKCDRYLTKQDDGLSVPWTGRVWCNPPYGKQIIKWVKKAWEESKNCEVIVMLVHARTDTNWFHAYVYGKAELRFVKGRLKFGGAKYNAPFPSMIVIYKKMEAGT